LRRVFSNAVSAKSSVSLRVKACAELRSLSVAIQGDPLAREQRKLAAIVAADVVGYSRLMGHDESGMLARLRKNRSERLDPVLTKYGGREHTRLGERRALSQCPDGE
jgi:class 3 adenylate cyclase